MPNKADKKNKAAETDVEVTEEVATDETGFPVEEEAEDEKQETRVRVLDCTFGDANPGDEISIPKASADYYESIGYVEIIKD